MKQIYLEEDSHLEGPRNKVAIAGDGINNATALAKRHVGIPIGAYTAAAIESAAITLIIEDLGGITKAHKLCIEV